MSSRYTIPVNSAHSWKQKITNLTREAIRRLLNIHRKLPWEEVIRIMNRFSKKMRRSQYSARVRKQVTIAAIAAYRKMRKNEEDGVRSLYRHRTWLERERSLTKAANWTNWAKVDRTLGEVARAPLIISPLAGSRVIEEMKKTCREFDEKTGIPVKLCQRGRSRIIKMIKSDPLRKGGCGDEKCMVCTSGGKGCCRRNGVQNFLP